MSVLRRNIVYLNGPPHCGKDEVAKFMSFRYNFIHLKFADVIKDIACAALSIDRNSLEAIKDTVHPTIEITLRTFLIWLSEDCFKPKFGENIFGKFAVEKIKTYGARNIIFSDNGFFDEFRATAYANYGGQNLVLEVHRPGHDFRQDSRSYWWEHNKHDAGRLAKHSILDNSGTLSLLRATASHKICKALGLEWHEEYSPLE